MKHLRVLLLLYVSQGTESEFLTASTDQKIRLWNMQTGEEELQFRSSGHEGVLSVVMIPKLKCAVTGHEDGHVAIW